VVTLIKQKDQAEPASKHSVNSSCLLWGLSSHTVSPGGEGTREGRWELYDLYHPKKKKKTFVFKMTRPPPAPPQLVRWDGAFLEQR
jgi:hypothetical protein